MTAIELNDVNFDSEVTRSTQPVLVDFYADWCGPCRKQLPIVEELVGDYAGKARIAKANVDNVSVKAREYNVSSIPALLIFKNGQIVERMVGLHSKSQLAEIIDKFL